MLLATLGDSLSCGEGVGLRVPLSQTWVGLLASAMPGTTHICLAQPGARTADLVHEQLPHAVDAEPALATVAIGLNDVSRGGFDVSRTRADLHLVVDGLLATGAHVLVTRLHDPTRLLPLPSGLRRAVQDRVSAVNAAVDDCVGARVLQLDLASVPVLATRAGWAVDRLHPSLDGHAAIARVAAQVLRDGGWFVRSLETDAVAAREPSRLAEAAWVVRHGVPWLASHTVQVGAPLLAMTARGAAPVVPELPGTAVA